MVASPPLSVPAVHRAREVGFHHREGRVACYPLDREFDPWFTQNYLSSTEYNRWSICFSYALLVSPSTFGEYIFP